MEHVHGTEWASTLTLAAAAEGETEDMDTALSGAILSADAGEQSTPAPPPVEEFYEEFEGISQLRSRRVRLRTPYCELKS